MTFYPNFQKKLQSKKIMIMIMIMIIKKSMHKLMKMQFNRSNYKNKKIKLKKKLN